MCVIWLAKANLLWIFYLCNNLHLRFHHLSISCLQSEWAYSSLSHMDSNSSMRCLVLPWRILRRVLYLSRPAFTLSAWIRSLWVFLLSSTAPASSVLKNWKRTRAHSEWNALPWDSLRDYSEALLISPNPCTPLSPHLLSIVINSILWVLYATSYLVLAVR